MKRKKKKQNPPEEIILKLSPEEIILRKSKRALIFGLVLLAIGIIGAITGFLNFAFEMHIYCT